MKFFKKTDIIIIIIIIFVAIAAWVSYRFTLDNSVPKAEIYYCSELVLVVGLEKGNERKLSIPEAPNVIFHLFKDGTICFEESDCPDKVCIEAGRIGTPGQFAACLPNKVLLKIVSGDNKKGEESDIIIGN